VLVGGFSQPAGGNSVVVRRSIIEGVWFSDQVAAVENPFGALGVMVASAQAVAAGVASLPDPVTEITSDVWRIYQPLFVSQGATAVSKPVHRFVIDTRVNYKLQAGTDASIVVANGSAGAGANIWLTMSIYSQVSS